MEASRAELSDQEYASRIAANWLAEINERLAAADSNGIAGMFSPDGAWRDILALDWCMKTYAAAQLPKVLAQKLAHARFSGLRLQTDKTAPLRLQRADVECIEFFIAFDHRRGRGQGIVRVITDAAGCHKTWQLFTFLDTLTGFEEKIGSARPRRSDGSTHSFQNTAQPGWTGDVIVIGGGQAGLSIAARLGRMGVSALVLEQHQTIGQNWRNRYDSLTLHNGLDIAHMPYMRFPDSWPNYLSKDRVADWLEFYARAMDLDIWANSAVQSCAYDERAGLWHVTLKQGASESITVRCKHLVVATGLSGRPKNVSLPGLSDFQGQIVHSSDYRNGSAFRGRKAIVVGTGASGHDIAQDLYNRGAKVSLVQRGSMSVCSVEPGASDVLDALFRERPQVEADLIVASIPYETKIRNAQIQTARLRELDADLFAGLEEIGFKLDFGEDDTGIAMKYLRKGGGFYLNVGCSDLLVSKDITLLQSDEITSFEGRGARLSNGMLEEADLVVLAIGYETQGEANKRLLGEDLTEQLGSVWGTDENGEQRNVWCRTGVTGLWFMMGNLQQCRFYSKVLALQICADL